MSRLFTPASVPSVPPPPPAASVNVPQVYPKVADWMSRIQGWTLLAAAFLVPLLFNPWNLDAVELNKQSALIILSIIALVAWLGEGVARKQFALSKSWVHLAVASFGVGYLIISAFSQNRYMSLAGALGQMSWPFVTVAALVVMYLVIVNHVRTLTQVYNLAFAFLLSCGVAALYGLMQLFGWYVLPAGITHTANFNTVGSMLSLAMFLVTPLVMGASIILHGCRDQVCVLGQKHPWSKGARITLWVVMASCLAFLIATDFISAWITLLMSTVFVVGIGYFRTKKMGRPEQMILPGILVAVSVAFIILPVPSGLKLPTEVAPSLKASWEVARQSLQAHPLFGSGPGTWVDDYAQYRDRLVNLSPFWNVRFDRALTAFMTLLASIGLVGTALWLLLVGSVIVKSGSHLLKERDEDRWYVYVMVFTGWISVVIAAFFYNYNVSHQFAFWLLLALLGFLVNKNVSVWSAKHQSNIFGVLALLLVVCGVLGVAGIWVAGQRLVADAYFLQSIEQYNANKPVDSVIDRIEKATHLNPYSDTYARNLSQAYLIRALATVQNSSLPDPIKASQPDVSASVEVAKKAVDLAPSNVDNWTNLGFIYRAIASFTRGADQFAITNYQEAIKREPQNPAFYDGLAVLYILRAEAYAPQVNSKDTNIAANARGNVTQNLALAEQQLQKSIQTKPDYLPAHYHLGVVYERQGKLPQATAELEQALLANNHDTGMAFELALLYVRANKMQQAQNLLQQVAQVEPTNANALWYLSAVDEQVGKLSEALQAVQTLNKLMPENATVRDRLTYLNKLITTKSAQGAPGLPEPLKEDVHSQEPTNLIIKK